MFAVNVQGVRQPWERDWGGPDNKVRSLVWNGILQGDEETVAFLANYVRDDDKENEQGGFGVGGGPWWYGIDVLTNELPSWCALKSIFETVDLVDGEEPRVPVGEE